MGAIATQKTIYHVPVCTAEEPGDADAVIFDTPTRFGNMYGHMRQFLDATGKLWASGTLFDKAESVFTSSNTQHGGQETIITSFHLTLFHHGMNVVGLPFIIPGTIAYG